MHILMVITSMRIGGGIGTSVAALANALTERGHAVHIASLAGPGPLINRLDIPRDRIVDLSGRHTAARIAALVREIAARRIDIVHTHQFDTGLVGRVAAWLAGCATISSAHSTLYPPWRRRHYAIDRLLARRTDALHAVSHPVARALAERIGIPVDGISVVHNMVDPQRFRPVRRDTGGRAGRRRILFVGRLEQSKNLDCAISAFALLRGRGIDAHLTLVGDGSMRSRLERLVAASGLADHISLEREVIDMPAMMQSMDMLFMPSRWEGCPVSIIEAHATRLPVAAAAVPGILEIVVPNETGLVFAPGDAAGAADALQRLCTDEALAGRLAQAAQERARQFSPDALAPRMLALYASVLDRRGVRPAARHTAASKA